MSTAITDTNTYALYDTTSGFAFGPTFESEDDAEEFVTFVYSLGYFDIRDLSDKELEELYGRFMDGERAEVTS